MRFRLWKTSLVALALFSACGLDDSTPLDQAKTAGGDGQLSTGTGDAASTGAVGSDSGAGADAAPQAQAVQKGTPADFAPGVPEHPSRCQSDLRAASSRSAVPPPPWVRRQLHRFLVQR